MSPVLVGALLGSTVAYLKKIGKIPYSLEEALEILMGHPIGDDVTWEDNNDDNLGDEVTWNAAPQQTKVKFPRAKADKIVKKVEKHLKPYVDKMMACGSYRRGAQMIGDIDFVLILKPGYDLPEVLPANEGINWVGNKKAQVIIDGEKVDFRVTTPDAWGATILYFTGPADFNIKYRWMAKKRGLKLSEYGLFDRNTGKYIAGKTENDIFTALGRPYKNPDVRKGFRAEYQPNQTLADYSPQDLTTSSVVTGDFTTDSLKYGFGPTALSAETFKGEMEEYPSQEIDNSFTSMPNMAYITLPNYEEAYYWTSADGNSRATVAYDDEKEVIVIPNFEVSQRVRGLKKAHQYLQELIDDAYQDGYGVQVVDVDNHAIGFWKKMQTRGLIEGWTQGSFAAEDDTFRVYRRMSWEQYFDALETGYLMPPKMRSEIDGFKNSKSFLLQDSIYAATFPSWKSPLPHLQDNVLPTFEIELLATDDFIKYGNGVVTIDNAIPIDRVTPFSTSEKVSTFQAEDNYEATYGKEQAKIRRRLKKKIMAQAIMGTKAGQWSARKSQELKRQYEAACEKRGLRAYKGNKTQKQQNLTDWSRQKWGTASGKKSSKTGEPYFPAKAIEALKDRGLYAKAKRQKAAATKAGKQHARYSDDIREVVKPFRAENQWSADSVVIEPENSHAGWYNPEQDAVTINLAGVNELKINNLVDVMAHEYGHKATTQDTFSPYQREFAAFMVQTQGNFSLSKILTFLQPRCHPEILQQLPSENGIISDETLDNYFSTLDVESNPKVIEYAKFLTQQPEYPNNSKDLLEHFIRYAETGTCSEPFRADFFEAPLGRRSRRQSKILNEAEKIMGTKIWNTPELQDALYNQGIQVESRTLGYLLGIDSRFEMMGKTKIKGVNGRSYEVNTWRLVIKEAESFVTLDIKDMDRFLRNRRFKPVDIKYRNQPVKEWVYERALPCRQNHVVRVYTSINRYGRQQGRGRDVGRDAIRVQVIYRDSKGETLVSSPTRVHRIGTWEKNLDQRLKTIAEEKPQVVFDSRGEPMTLRKYKGKLFWGSRDYPKYKETKSI